MVLTSLVLPSDPGVVVVGNALTRETLETKPFPVALKGKPSVWMDISYKICFDPEREYPTVQSAFVGIFAADGQEKCLCHFDYERNKRDDYPDAHIQVHGDNEAVNTWGDPLKKRGLKRLHFPAGHRRFRWTLEDVIEFMVRHEITPGRDGWKEELRPSREEFHRLQLRAAIRREPDTALEYLRQKGYKITPPDHDPWA